MHDNSLRPKCIFVAVMIRRMMDAFLNKVALDDKVCTDTLTLVQCILSHEAIGYSMNIQKVFI